MLICKVCGEQKSGGVIMVHTDCFNNMVAEIEKLKKDRAKAKKLFDEIAAIGEKMALDGRIDLDG